MNNQRRLTPCDDNATIHSIRKWLDNFIESPGSLNLQTLRSLCWLTVPVESAAHFNEDDSNNLAHAMQLVNCRYCFGIATEPLNSFPLTWWIEATSSGLLDFSWECAHFNFAVVSESKEFLILCTVYDYYIVAGPEKFVRPAVEGDINRARLQFDEFAGDCERLRKVAKRYA